MNKNNDIERIGTGEDAERPVPIQASQIGTGWEEEDKADEGFRSRLKALVGEHGSIAALARLCGIGESTLRKWVDGPSEPNRARLVAIARGAGVNLVWLATGEGPRERDNGQDQGTAAGAPAPRVARPVRRGAGSRVGIYEPDEDPAYQRWPLEVGVFHAVVNAAEAVGSDLERGDRVEIGRYMYLAIDILALASDNRLRLDEGDMQALARIVRKLILPSQ